jgi:uncharacterized protein YlxW (UPF0749 family)
LACHNGSAVAVIKRRDRKIAPLVETVPFNLEFSFFRLKLPKAHSLRKMKLTKNRESDKKAKVKNRKQKKKRREKKRKERKQTKAKKSITKTVRLREKSFLQDARQALDNTYVCCRF